jgi:hypothetical protein
LLFQCLRFSNTLPATNIGAFRFVCTNLAVGGGGVFAGGFMSVHVGSIALDQAAAQLTSYLAGFERIVALYRGWIEMPFEADPLFEALPPLPRRTHADLRQAVEQQPGATVYAAYNAATWVATHRMRSAHGAFELLDALNRAFQERFPVAVD